MVYFVTYKRQNYTTVFLEEQFHRRTEGSFLLKI